MHVVHSVHVCKEDSHCFMLDLAFRLGLGFALAHRKFESDPQD